MLRIFDQLTFRRPAAALCKRVLSLILFLLVVFALLPSHCRADVETMKHGLALLQGGRYAEAASDFAAITKSNPTDEQAHYCLAVCLHFSSKYVEASKEYNWVCRHGKDAQLVRRAQKGLSGVSGYAQAAKNASAASASSTSSPASTSAAPSSTSQVFDIGVPNSGMAGKNLFSALPNASSGVASDFKGNMNGTSAASGSGAPGEAANTTAPVEPLSGTERIVDVFTVWCGPCKRFAPIFHEAASKYSGSGVTFDSLDAEAPENKAFVDQYGVHSFPTILFIDGNGTLVNTHHGVMSAEQFDQEICRVWPQLKR
jgi:thioredoxin-like negative regulator of GroEL